MLENLKNRLEAARRDEGFTLIELMVVVLIIAVLLAIAIPTFLGAQSKSKDRSAQSSARNAMTAANTYYADNGTFTGVFADIDDIEPSLTFLDAAVSTGPKAVSISGSGEAVYAAVLSDTDKCFFMKDDKSGSGTQFAEGAAATCNAGATGAQAGSVTWSDKW